MTGILVEKPSAARNFAKALGGLKGTYDGTPFVIAAARGHLYEYRTPDLQVPADQAAMYKSWDLANLPWDETAFAWKRVKKKDTDDLLKSIKATLGACDEIVIATDVDPSGEGELLAWEILDELSLKSKKITRMYFVDEAAGSIQKAFRDRKPLPRMQDDPDFRKAQFRSQWDFLSMQFTRIATKCGDGGSILRQGRLKSAMVQIVGDGLEALSQYKKIPYYQNRFRDENGILYTNPNEPQFPDKAQVPQTYHASDVVCDAKTRKATVPPGYLDLAGLSARLASKGFKAKAVLDVYQKMYENQIVSYPRNEDKRITPEQFNELLPLADRIAAVAGVDVKLLTHRAPRKTHVGTKNPNGKGVSHGANRPGPNVPARLSDLDVYGDCAQEIYRTLALNYLATLAEDYEYESQKGHVKDYPDFVGTTSVPLAPGWKLVFQDDADVDDAGKALGTRAEPFVFEGFPPKPPTPTWSWLKSQLEKYDVGTGATRTSTYAEVTNDRAKYPLLKDSRGKITMSEFGEMSYHLLRNTHIGDLKLTEQVYAEMDGVADGSLKAEDCLAKIRQYVLDDMKVMQDNGVDMRKALGKTLQTSNAKEKYEGRWKGKMVKFTRTWAGHRFTDDECRALCAGEEIEVRGLVSAKTGREYGVLGKLTKQSYNGHEYVGFERTGFLSDNPNGFDGQGGAGGDFKRPEGVPKTWCGHRFTDDERTLLESGQPLLVTDAVSKKTGKKFSCTLTYEKREDTGEMGIVPRFS